MDILIRNGILYDGTGAPPRRADIGVGGGHVLLVDDRVEAQAATVIDAEGLAVAPGFIDLHSHSDESYAVDPDADGKIRQGVTTEVIGNCGSSAAPLGGSLLDEVRSRLRDEYGIRAPWQSMGEYFVHLEACGLVTNCVALVGHGNLRAVAAGRQDRRATAGERQLMQEMLEAALADGAWGLSSGLIYVPSMYGDVDELAALAAAAREKGGIYASHIRGEGDTLEEAVAEAVEIGRRARIRVEVSHHKASGPANWGKVARTLAMLESARAEGIEAACDQYPYLASSTGLDAVLPAWVREGGRAAMVERLLDPDARARVRTALLQHPYGDWSRVRVAQVRFGGGHNQELEGKDVAEVARRVGTSPEDALMNLLIEEQGEVAAVFFTMCDADVERVMADPHTAIGSDAAARSASGPLSRGKPHPRAFGTFPRVLGTYCNEKRLLRLEEGIHRMTGLPARRLGLLERGTIEEGMWADLVVFDPARVRDRATYEEPQQYPEGIAHVAVNGRLVVRDGAPTGERPGRILRRGVDGAVLYRRSLRQRT